MQVLKGFFNSSVWMNATITRPFNTAMPERAMKPTAAEIENGIPRESSARMPPVSAKGTPEKMIAASLNDRSAMISSPMMRHSVSGTTTARRLAAELWCVSPSR